MSICSSCGAENKPGRRFCSRCGTALGRTCPACGASNDPDDAFCGACGSALEAAPAPSAPAPAPVPVAEAERRLVSVLFADLVGFTALSESRDPEEVRELLSRYFDSCRRLIELYGGTVEKFIGDAVMAVWGAPVATEDDAERAVRAALDLVSAVAALGEEVGADDLRARAGVMTGEAAVTLGATGQGMVAGDLVNTASRVQSVAEPGSVFVGEATRRASESTVVYEEAGGFELKGKEGETQLWRARRVVSGRAGSLKSQGLEAPFVGRDRELRQIKELFHVCADEGRAQLVSVTGIAGIGKSRLAWEFYKYFDGIDQFVYWHRGRCLAYGEGVTYWALADMVRMRCGIAEEEEPEAALSKLHSALEEHVLDADERRFVEPRLAQLLGLGGHEQRERQDLFAAWRLFFERLAGTYPTVLAFEDMQWADAALLDFVEHLLEWSRDHPILVITLARPELLERRPTWGAGQRNFTAIYLEPLAGSAMQELLAGLVPGLPSGLHDQILARAEGVPLYAVETVRMLLDRGLLAEDGPSYRVVGEIESLAIPETLQALAAARLDGLELEERRVVQDASVLGKTFSLPALAALSGVDAAELEPMLGGLVRKELLGLQADPRSPEHGQYGFLQDLLRQVAYDTVARRDRRAKHLAAAEHLASTLGEDEVAEVIASHLLDAYRLDPEAADADGLRERASRALLAAGERAASLGATIEGSRFFEQAAELSRDGGEQAAALLRAGELAITGDAVAAAASALERAQALYEDAGDAHGVARVAGWQSLMEANAGRIDRAIERLEQAYGAIEADEHGEVHATLLTRLGQSYAFAGQFELATRNLERALDLSEALQLWEPLIRGWVGKAIALYGRRPNEVRGLYRLALETALEHDLIRPSITIYGNLSDLSMQRDRYAESLEYLEQSLTICRRLGDRRNERFVISEQSYALMMLGRWDEALARVAELPSELIGSDVTLASTLTGLLEIYVKRGDLPAAQTLVGRFEGFRDTQDVQMRGAYHAALAAVRLAEGRPREALAAAEDVIAFGRETLGIGSQDIKQAFRQGLEAAFVLGEPDAVERLLRIVEESPPGLRPPSLTALADHYRARLAGADPSADRRFAAARARYAELDMLFYEAVVALEHGQWLAEHGRPDEAGALVAEARDTFERLGATPWLDRTAEIPVPAA